MRKKKHSPKDAHLPSIRCYRYEAELIRARARYENKSVGRYVIDTLTKINIDNDDSLLPTSIEIVHNNKSKVIERNNLVNELRRLGGLQKHLFKEGDGVLSQEYYEILKVIKKTIENISKSNFIDN